jgi:NADH dehydrogenase/NADH:ubiquinone oxidoreductase subunit G
VSVCPTGALFEKGKAVTEIVKERDLLPSLLLMRGRQR